MSSLFSLKPELKGSKQTIKHNFYHSCCIGHAFQHYFKMLTFQTFENDTHAKSGWKKIVPGLLYAVLSTTKN